MNGRQGRASGAASTVQGILGALIVAQFGLTFLAQGVRIPTGSMVPTLLVGDFVLVNKMRFARNADPLTHVLPSTPIERGDLIVFRYPMDTSRFLVKRVAGVPGDRVRLREGHLQVNGQPVPEPFAQFTADAGDVYRDDFPDLHATAPEVEPAWWRLLRRDVRAGELTVPADEYFVLGDNRNESDDSRYWGFVPRADVEGSPALVYFSLASADVEDAGPWRRLRHGLQAAHRLR